MEKFVSKWGPLISAIKCMFLKRSVSKKIKAAQRHTVLARTGLAILLSIALTNVSAAPIPGTVSPGQIERQFDAPPEPKVSDEVVVPAAKEQAAPDNADQIRFRLVDMEVVGSTVYNAEQLKPYFSKLLQQEVTLTDIYKVANRLTTKYRNDGYILSRVIVPAQRIKTGKVQLQAVEGYINSVNIKGEIQGPKTLLDAYANKITQSRPLHADDLERYLLLMNDLDGVVARATLSPSTAATGASDLTVAVAHSKVTGSFGVSNRGSRYLGPTQADLQVDLNSVFGAYEHTNLRVISTGNDELNYASIIHEQNLGTEGARLGITVSGSKSEPGLVAPLNTLETDSVTAAITYTYPVIRTRTQNLYARGSFTLHNGKTDNNPAGDTEDRIRAVRLGMTYDRVDRWRGVNILDVELSQGINGLNATETGSPNLSRPGAKSDFTKLNVYVARLQSLASHWSLLFAATGQYAADDVLSPEEFGFGGEHFGRAFDASEITGDIGGAGKLELRYTGKGQSTGLSAYTLYASYEGGKIWRRNRGAGESKEEGAESVGLGMRFNLGRKISGYVEVNKPLNNDIVAAEGNDDERVFGGLAFQF